MSSSFIFSKGKLGDVARFNLCLKCFPENATNAMAVFEEALSCFRVEEETAKEALSEALRRIKERHASFGKDVAMARSLAFFQESRAKGEKVFGASAFLFLSDLFMHYNKMSETFRQGLRLAKDALFAKTGLIVGVSGIGMEDAGLGSLLASLKESDGEDSQVFAESAKGVATSNSMVDFALSFPIEEFSGAWDVLSNMIGSGFVDPVVRAKGGAYCAGCGLGRKALTLYAEKGDARKALKAFNELPEFLESFKYSERELKNLKIGAMNKRLRVPHPSGMLSIAATFAMEGASEDDLAAEAEEILSLAPGFEARFADLIEEGLKKGHFCAVGNERLFPEGVEALKLF
jgi:Zn-dependent M16 (insulinase) family peptidase